MRTVMALRVGMAFDCTPEETTYSCLENVQRRVKQLGVIIRIHTHKTLKGGWTVTRIG